MATRRFDDVMIIPTFTSLSKPQQALMLREGLVALLGKGATWEMEPRDRQASFVSCYFWFPSRTWGSDFGPQGPQPLSLAAEMQNVDDPQVELGHAGDWFATIDLKDACVQIQED